ncbi:MAG: trypsin-like serine protease [Deltaproteobacteria bacterium]|nr:trypsin-like serine protease [Deltaproteobacteria bacterium]
MLTTVVDVGSTRLSLMLVTVTLAGCPGEIGADFAWAPGSDRDGGVSVGRDGDAGAQEDGSRATEADGGGPTDLPDDGPADECGDLRTAIPIYNGTAEPTVVPLAPGQVIAVGTFGGCSGALIAPSWVLTATHCGLYAGAEFCIGEEPGQPDTCLGSVGVVDNPSGDMTLVELDRDAREALPSVVPIPILTEGMDEGWVGRMAEAAGYGEQEDGSSGEREFTAEPIASISGDTLTIDGEGQRGVCFGDSGGPVMVVASDGTARVAGDLSNGDGSCVGQDNFTRVDVYREWIEESTGPTAPPDGCGDVGNGGRCLDGAAIWCEGDELRSEPCAGGLACGWDAAAGGFRCVDGGDPCAGLDAVGRCEGSVARWCDRGRPRSRDCGACGQACDESTTFGGAYCVDDPCGGLDYLGRCSDDVAEWCEDGELRSEDCGARGEACRWISDDTGYWCG